MNTQGLANWGSKPKTEDNNNLDEDAIEVVVKYQVKAQTVLVGIVTIG